jgi:hypothetical protein
MNMSTELRKPLCWFRGQGLTLAEAKTVLPQTTGANLGSGRQADRATRLVAVEALNKLKRQGIARTRQLVVQRLRAVPRAKFRLLDGRIFSGREAANEVERGSPEGEYFLQLERRTLEIVLQALQSGRDA